MISFGEGSGARVFADGQLTRQSQEPPKQPERTTLNKYQSEPKFTSIKEEILKIPKVRQILQKDRFVYAQDIEKRMELLGSVKNDRYEPGEKKGLNDLSKKLQSRTRRHKTNFKIPLTRKNIQSLNCLVKDHISQNQVYKNEQRWLTKEYQNTAPFDLEKLKFMDDLNPVKVRYKQKFPDFKEGVLSKNKLLLEHVVLNRNIKREMKLDHQKKVKESQKKMFSTQQPS